MQTEKKQDVQEEQILEESRVLSDKNDRGRERPWREKKLQNQLLAVAYDDVDPRKATRLRDCASVVTFVLGENGKKQLDSANFCRVRLCPMCAWRRSLKIFGHTQKILAGMESEKPWGYILVTLTVRNIGGGELDECLDLMMAAWHRFTGYKRVKTAVKGWYRGLEVTHNVNPISPNFDTYHPHFHCLFAVNKGYFKGPEYIRQDEWQSLWRRALSVDYAPVVDVRRVRGNTTAAVAEVAKYAVKEADYIIPDDWDLSVSTVRLLDTALARRRLVAYGEKFKEWHRRLNLDDEVDGDLIHTADSDPLLEDEKLKRVTYFWNVGYSQYLGNEM